jgi:hypothetical protein
LEGAGLIVARRRGREKLHFLNAIPIRLIHDRRACKYTEPWAAALSGLNDTTGSGYEGVGGGTNIFEGENLEVDPPRRLVQSFRALWNADVKSEGTSGDLGD